MLGKLKQNSFKTLVPWKPLEHEGTAFQAHNCLPASLTRSLLSLYSLQARCCSSTEHSNWESRPGLRPQLSSRVLTPHVPDPGWKEGKEEEKRKDSKRLSHVLQSCL